MSDQSSGNESKNSGKMGWVKIVLMVLAVFIVITIGGLWIITRCCSSPSDFWQTAGQFGDTCGVFNALFSGLALFFIGWTLYLQRRQLKTQEKELHQNTTLMAQQIADSKFFTILNQLKTYMAETKFSTSMGHEAYKLICGELPKLNFVDAWNRFNDPSVKSEFEKFFKDERFGTLFMFFAFVKMIYVLIEESTNEKLNTVGWADLARSLFIKEELELLYQYAHCQKTEGQTKTLDMFEKHSLFKDFVSEFQKSQ